MRCLHCSSLLESQTNTCKSCGWTDSPENDLFLGKIIGERYKLLQKIGAGSCGSVYAAEHLSLQNKLAIKILHTTLTRDPTLVERFRREATVMSRLTHPHALKLFDRGETPEGASWFAMELLEGEPLSARLLRNELFSERELLGLLESICEVLAEAHQLGIVHRDLKPANLVLVRGPGGAPLAKLLDFGISDLRGSKTLTHPKLVSGTPVYMAPEQWKGLSHANARSDIYSLGVIAYQCLSGKLPLDADTPLAWLKKHQSEEPQDLQAAMGDRPLSIGVSQTIMRSLSKIPEERPQSALAFFESFKTSLPRSIVRSISKRKLRSSAEAAPKMIEPPPTLNTQADLPKEASKTSARSVRPSMMIGALGILLLGGLSVPLLSSSPVSIPTNTPISTSTIAPMSVPSAPLPQSTPSAPRLNSSEPTTMSSVPASMPMSQPTNTPTSIPTPKKQVSKNQIPQSALPTDSQDTINPWIVH
jgi:serine/threonine protein kinase